MTSFRHSGYASVYIQSCWRIFALLVYVVPAVPRCVPCSKYSHWPGADFSSSGSHLNSCQRGLSRKLETTYTLEAIISSTRVSSPSATRMTSSISPAPILFSISSILENLSASYRVERCCSVLIRVQRRLLLQVTRPGWLRNLTSLHLCLSRHALLVCRF